MSTTKLTGLPEVEVARRWLQQHCLGGVIVKATIADDPDVFDGVSPSALKESLIGKLIVAANRKGKHLWLELNSPPWPSFYLGMGCRFIHKLAKDTQHASSSAAKETKDFPLEFSKVHLQLDSGVEVTFTCDIGVACVRLLPDPAKVPPISNLGLDAHLQLPSQEDFIKAVQGKAVSIKALLSDETFLAGIGDWVADEVLYQSKVHPEQPASTLTDDECKHIHTNIKEVLDTAVGAGAASFQFPEHWLYHGSLNKKPGLIGENKIWAITVGGRKSLFVPAMQKYNGPELEGAEIQATFDDGEAEPATVDDPEGPASKKMKLGSGAGASMQGAAAADKGATGSQAGPSAPKRRGRPPKASTQGTAAADKDATGSQAGPSAPKRRGRPPKAKSTPAGQTTAGPAGAGGDTSEGKPVGGRKRGRPPKLKTSSAQASPAGAIRRGPPRKGKAFTEQESPAGATRRGPPRQRTPGDMAKEAVSKASSQKGSSGEKRRGRPPKAKPDNASSTSQAADKPVKKRGRPKKEAGPSGPKRRGRPPKVKDAADNDPMPAKKVKLSQVGKGSDASSGKAAAPAQPKRRGRPPKAKSAQDKANDTAAPKKRGRPPKAKKPTSI